MCEFSGFNVCKKSSKGAGAIVQRVGEGICLALSQPGFDRSPASHMVP